LPHSSGSAPHSITAAVTSHLGKPTTLLPDLTPVIPHLPPHLPSQSPEEVDWANVLADPHCALTRTNLVTIDPGAAMMKPAMNWNAISPTFLDTDVRKNEHELNLTSIPNALQMMIHLKLFIPLSMLTTASLLNLLQ